MRTRYLYLNQIAQTVTSKSVDEIEGQIVRLVHDSISKGKITRDEGFVLLQRIVTELEDEIALASNSSTN